MFLIYGLWYGKHGVCYDRCEVRYQRSETCVSHGLASLWEIFPHIEEMNPHVEMSHCLAFSVRLFSPVPIRLPAGRCRATGSTSGCVDRGMTCNLLKSLDQLKRTLYSPPPPPPTHTETTSTL